MTSFDKTNLNRPLAGRIEEQACGPDPRLAKRAVIDKPVEVEE
jgi:hypothetical protein